MDEPDVKHEPTRRNWTSFWSLMGLQAQNAFNDKALQFTLVPLGAWLASGAAWGKSLPHLLGMLILLPFILFAPVAGWASDSFSKTRVIRLTAWMQLVVLGVVLLSFGMQALPLAVGCFFFLALQSTILSPAKNGIIKELLGSTHLGFASGIMQMLTILAILAGQILIGIWFSARLEVVGTGWQAGLFPMVLITLGAVVTLVMAYSIEVVPPVSAKRFRARLLVSHFGQLGQLLGSRPLRLSALGIAYFWAFGTVMQFIALQVAGELYPDGHPNFGRATSFMMLAASGGIAVGSVIGAMINKRHIELGLNPVGGILMMVSSLFLFVAEPETILFYAALSGAGFGAAFFFVPINAFLQDECDPEQRGNILAGSALLNCLAMALAVVLQLVLLKVGVSTEVQFLLVGLTAVAATWYVMRLLPRAFVKLLTISAVRALYRIDAIHPKRMPDRGGVLLTPNHISYLDALILTAASPRPVRFVMVRSYFSMPLVGKVAELFDTIPISERRAKDAIRVASEALEEGSVVCIFPEGMLSRSGFLGEVKKGFELIARRAGCPVQAVYLDGLWKSIFSAERGKFFWKWPRKIPFGVRVAFDEPQSGRECRAPEVKNRLNALATVSFTHRKEYARDLHGFLRRRGERARAVAWWDGGRFHRCGWGEVKKVVKGSRSPQELANGHEGARRWFEEWKALAALPDEEVRRLILNTFQVADPHDLGDGKHPVLVDGEAPQAALRVWGMLLPALARSHAVLYGPRDDSAEFLAAARREFALRDIVGTERMRDLLGEEGTEGALLRLYRFEGGAQRADDSAAGVFACHQFNDRVVSISVPHAPGIRKGEGEEPGWRTGSFGRVLTGFETGLENGELTVGGEVVKERFVMRGWSVDPAGFLFNGAGQDGGGDHVHEREEEALPSRPA